MSGSKINTEPKGIMEEGHSMEMTGESVLRAQNLRKKYKGFELSIPQLTLPKGFATALIGENGAGKA